MPLTLQLIYVFFPAYFLDLTTPRTEETDAAIEKSYWL